MIHYTAVRDFYKYFVLDIESAGYVYRGRGSFRAVYHRGNSVIKVPSNSDGIVDNFIEAKAYKHYGNKPTSLGIYLAPCRLLPNYCLIMGFARAIKDCEMPGWADAVEGMQVGRYNGRVVAYDYALDLEERYAWEEESGYKSNYFQSDWKDQKPELFPQEVINEYRKSLE